MNIELLTQIAATKFATVKEGLPKPKGFGKFLLDKGVYLPGVAIPGTQYNVFIREIGDGCSAIKYKSGFLKSSYDYSGYDLMALRPVSLREFADLAAEYSAPKAEEILA